MRASVALNLVLAAGLCVDLACRPASRGAVAADVPVLSPSPKALVETPAAAPVRNTSLGGDYDG